MEPKRLHETQPAQPIEIPEDPYNEQIASLQRVEGFPLKKVKVRTLPVWLRVFFYFFAGCIVTMLFTALYINLFLQ